MLRILILILIAFVTNSCKTDKPKLQVDSNPESFISPYGIEEVLKETDGDIMEFDVSADAKKIVYSTNAYRNVYQILLINFEENKKQYILPEDTEQRSPKIENDDIYFIRVDTGNSYITNYNIKQNVIKTLFKINGLALTLSAKAGNISFAVSDKNTWKIWLLQEGKFIFVDNGFYPFLTKNNVYYQKPNQKGEPLYSIYNVDISNGTKYTIFSSGVKSYLNPAVSEDENLLSFVEFSDSTYYLKLYNLKNFHSYTLLKSSTPILSPNLAVRGYVYFIKQTDNKFSIYRIKIS
jgi:hypothetical protein